MTPRYHRTIAAVLFKRSAFHRVSLRSVLISAAATGLAGSAAQAHVRWFTDPDDPSLAEFGTYALTDPAVIAWMLIAIVLVAIAVLLDGRLPRPAIANTKVRHDAMELMRILVGVSLLLTAYGEQVFAPHLTVSSGTGTALVFLQALIGMLLISNHFLHYAAVLLAGLFVGAIFQFGFAASIEYVNYVGIAFFLYFNHVPNSEWQARLKPYSVDVLRIFTGLALVILGYTEKLQGAILGQSFIANYDWNFMPALGFDWYSDQLFVLSAGMMEIVFGTILILGVVTRLNMLVISLFMLASNLVFLLQTENDAALTELIGHMPVIATAIILLLLGYGQRAKLLNPTLAVA